MIDNARRPNYINPIINIEIIGFKRLLRTGGRIHEEAGLAEGLSPSERLAFVRFLALVAGAGLSLLIALLALAGRRLKRRSPLPAPFPGAQLPEGVANCSKCHADGKKIEAARCLACHKAVAERIASKKGVHREVAGDCEACHQEHQGVEADIRPLDPADFNHAGRRGSFSKENTPAWQELSRLSQGPFLHGESADCGFCHAEPHQGTMPQTCEACHTPAGWTR